jgi:hypothetical protein
MRYSTRIIVICAATSSTEVSIPDLMNWIFDRMRKQDVIVIMKSLALIHELTRSGNARAMNYLSTVPSLFSQRDIHPLPSNHSYFPVFSEVIARYYKYLEDKLLTFRDVKIDYVKASINDIKQRLHYTPTSETWKLDVICLQRQLDSLLTTKV